MVGKQDILEKRYKIENIKLLLTLDNTLESDLRDLLRKEFSEYCRLMVEFVNNGGRIKDIEI